MTAVSTTTFDERALESLPKAPSFVAIESMAAKTEPGPLSVTLAALVVILTPPSVSVELANACQEPPVSVLVAAGPERLVT